MGAIIIFCLVIYILTPKKENKRKHRHTYSGKSDYEKLCDDGAKWFGW